MKRLDITLLLFLVVATFSIKTYAYDIAVENADGVMIYYNYTNNKQELSVTYRLSKLNTYSGSVVIPSEVVYQGLTLKVTSIDNLAFRDCIELASIEIPSSVTSIGYSAFEGCTLLTSIEIPSSVTSIQKYTFMGCTSLSNIKVDDNNQKFDSRNDCNAIIETESNTLITGCVNTVIPSSVTSIGRSAFSGCTGLTSINIPSSVTSIGGGAFMACI